MRADGPRALADALALRTVVPSGWRHGLAASADAGVFVTPAIDGFVFAVGRDLGVAATDPELVEALAARFGTAAGFVADAEVDVFGWAFAGDGRVRAYRYEGDDGHVLEFGEITAEEHALGCFAADPRDGSDDGEAWWPDAALVHRLAAAWARDPATFDACGVPPSAGLLGRR